MIGSLNKEALPKYLGALPLSYKKLQFLDQVRGEPP